MPLGPENIHVLRSITEKRRLFNCDLHNRIKDVLVNSWFGERLNVSLLMCKDKSIDHSSCRQLTTPPQFQIIPKQTKFAVPIEFIIFHLKETTILAEMPISWSRYMRILDYAETNKIKNGDILAEGNRGPFELISTSYMWGISV